MAPAKNRPPPVFESDEVVTLLAYLALGRISHEQGKYDDAYYFYFRVPEDSDRLPDALFEASWSMFQKGEYEAAGAFIDQFDRMFPSSPLAPGD